MLHSSLFQQSLSELRRPALWWGLGWLFFGLLIFFFLSSLRFTAPAWLVDWLGSLAGVDLNHPSSLLAGLGLGLLLPLGLGTSSAWLGSRLIAPLRTNGTLALLLAAPMPRTRLLDARLAVFLLLTAALGLGLGLLFELLAAILGPHLPFGRFLVSLLHQLLLTWLAGGISLLASNLGAGPRQAFAWGLVSLATRIAYSFLTSLFSLPWLTNTSLLQLAARGGILQAYPVGWHSLVLLILAGILILLTRAAFSRQDLQI